MLGAVQQFRACAALGGPELVASTHTGDSSPLEAHPTDWAFSAGFQGHTEPHMHTQPKIKVILKNCNFNIHYLFIFQESLTWGKYRGLGTERKLYKLSARRWKSRIWVLSSFGNRLEEAGTKLSVWDVRSPLFCKSGGMEGGRAVIYVKLNVVENCFEKTCFAGHVIAHL